MKFNKELIDNLAGKLMIGLSEEENETVLKEFKLIEDNMELINQIDGIENVEIMSHPFDLFQASLREDEPKDSIPFKEAIKNCDVLDGREVKVPKTLY